MSKTNESMCTRYMDKTGFDVVVVAVAIDYFNEREMRKGKPFLVTELFLTFLVFYLLVQYVK